MGEIRIVSASAGSGKTFRLAQLLEEEIVAGRVRPEAVLATTFTCKAAAELRARVRGRLLGEGRVLEAERLGAALIGTVNAVCGELVSLHAFELGLSPALRVLDEKAAREVMRAAVSDALDDAMLARLGALRSRMEQLSWDDVVYDLVAACRANAVDVADLREMAQRSRLEMAELVGAPVHGDLDAALERAVVDALDALAGIDDATATTAKVRDVLERARGLLSRGGRPSWGEWLKLAGLAPAKASRAAVAPVNAAAAMVDAHPAMHADVDAAVTLLFEVAARAAAAYAERKRGLGAIDFVDQEAHALALLARDEVREELAERVDLVLVDEFQDTSPLQLAIFLRLAEVARASVWVGDQKQAIYGFRGTDPALMDGALRALPAPETLGRSYRSRPPLVRLTSDLFAPAFARVGLGEAFTRLEPAQPHDDPRLGPPVELWYLEGKGRAAEVPALAAAVVDFLADPAARVRDVGSGEVRRARADDVAVLCRRNATCARVAEALEAAGMRVVLGRKGLLARPEARLVEAGLRLWADPRDTLAAAELARLVRYADDADGFLTAALQAGGRDAFGEVAEVVRVATWRRALPHAGVLEAFDRVVEAVQARERCLEWGDAVQRLANLDALRARCAAWSEAAAAEQRPATVAGLLVELARAAAEGDDDQAVPPADGAVTVLTWHGAKGLEWPVTVLFELEHARAADLRGVRVVSEAPFTFAAPLAGRGVRLWVDPFRGGQSGGRLHQRFLEHPAMAAATEAQARESLRLLYVGWTRARDRLVLTGRAGRVADGLLGVLGADLAEPPLTDAGRRGSDGASTPISSGEAERAPGVVPLTWSGHRFDARVRVCRPLETTPRQAEPAAGPVARGPRPHPPLRVPPSSVEATAEVGAPIRIGDALRLGGASDMSVVGEVVHGFLAADKPSLDATARFALAAGLVSRWQLGAALAPRSLLRAGDALRTWVDGRWPQATWRREWPVELRLDNGQVMRGAVDLVLETIDGLVVIDHKSFPGSEAQAVERAATHAGQLSAYARILEEATGRRVVGTWIHLPLVGLVVPVSEADIPVVV